jgi:hypothetical protein
MCVCVCVCVSQFKLNCLIAHVSSKGRTHVEVVCGWNWCYCKRSIAKGLNLEGNTSHKQYSRVTNKNFVWKIKMIWLVTSTFGVICVGLHSVRATRWRSWMRHWAIRYKPEGRGFDSRWCHWNFSLTYFLRRHYVPGVDSASNRNDYQEYFLAGKGDRSVGLITFTRRQSWNLGASNSWNPQGFPGL